MGQLSKIHSGSYDVQETTWVNAVEACDLARHYGAGKKRVSVLKHINLTLPRGYVCHHCETLRSRVCKGEL